MQIKESVAVAKTKRVHPATAEEKQQVELKRLHDANSRPRFPLGLTVITPLVQLVADPIEVALALTRHSCGDWTESHPDDQEHNEQALADGSILVGHYTTSRGYELTIVTEGDRSVSRVLLPEEHGVRQNGETQEDFQSTYSLTVTKRQVHVFHN